MFERDGFLAARISYIAATAGLSQGFLYHYFDSKEQIFREVAEAQEQRLIGAPVAATQHHFADQPERTIRRLQREGLMDTKLHPRIAADAL